MADIEVYVNHKTGELRCNDPKVPCPDNYRSIDDVSKLELIERIRYLTNRVKYLEGLAEKPFNVVFNDHGSFQIVYIDGLEVAGIERDGHMFSVVYGQHYEFQDNFESLESAQTFCKTYPDIIKRGQEVSQPERWSDGDST